MLNSKNRDITIDDINNLALVIKRINELEQKYNESILERRDIALELKNLLDELRLFSNIFDKKANELFHKYDYLSCKENKRINDTELAIRLILRLANTGDKEYISKKFYSKSFISPESIHGDRDYCISNDSTLFIGEKNVLDKIDNHKIYYDNKLGCIAHDLIKDGHSLIIATNSYFESNIRPGTGLKFFENIDVSESTIKGDPNIWCYLFDDELKIAVEKFMLFIDEVTSDINGIDEDVLFDLINKKDCLIRKK